MMRTTYSPDFKQRATAREVDDGVEVSFWTYEGSTGYYGLQREFIAPPDDAMWRLTSRGVIAVPMHVAIDRAYEVLRCKDL